MIHRDSCFAEMQKVTSPCQILFEGTQPLTSALGMLAYSMGRAEEVLAFLLSNHANQARAVLAAYGALPAYPLAI